jgi:hypothetical protein
MREPVLVEEWGPRKKEVLGAPTLLPQPAFGSGRRKQEIQVTTDLFFFQSLPQAH